MRRIAGSAAAVERIVAGGETVYGVNTGFGLLANTRIPNDRLAELQTNLILSHSAGLGDPLPRHVTRLMIVLKLLGLGRGYSGVRPLVIDALQALARRRCDAANPGAGQRRRFAATSRRSRTSSPRLMGYGRIDVAGEIMSAAAALSGSAWSRFSLGPKEGLALINGTQASTALALDALFKGERVFAAAIAAGALSVDALKGSAKPFDPRISVLARAAWPDPRRRGYPRLLEGSEILVSHVECSRVQDPYSFRCQPQVMGAALDLLDNAARTLTIEAGCGHRQSHRLSGRGHGDLRRQLPRPARRLRGRHDRHCPMRGRLDFRATRQRSCRSQDERPARLPHRGFGSELRADDPAGHGRSPGQREQEPGFPGERRFDPDVGRAGRPCVDGADRGAQGGADRAQCGWSDRGRVDGGVPRASTIMRRSRPRRSSGDPRRRCAPAHPHFTADRYWADEMAALQSAVLAGEIGGIAGLSVGPLS